MRFPLLCLFALLLIGPARAGEPFFKKGDVIALVGGEDMVVASEYGYLELLLTRALPDYHLRFRNLAWEGDTVFEQRRDLNFPSYEEQLDKIGATVVIAQFGQMESLAGKEKLPEFIAAYEKLLDRLGGEGKRRVVVIAPTLIGPQTMPDGYALAAEKLAQRKGLRAFPMVMASTHGPIFWTSRDGVHLDESSHRSVAGILSVQLAPEAAKVTESNSKALAQAQSWLRASGKVFSGGNTSDTHLNRQDEVRQLRQLIIAKNRLWFDYWRPQNWAFLAGDRTAQPSSRDHLDPSKRWFPPEREAFLPLIEAKEKEIDALAAQLAAANAGK